MPDKGKPLKPIPEHGTRQRYIHRLEPCHCDECSAANTAYKAGYRARMPRTPRAPSPPALSKRQQAVLRLVAQGMSNAEIAAELFVGEATVKTHVHKILTKFNLKNRAHAAAYAYESGLVVPQPRDTLFTDE